MASTLLSAGGLPRLFATLALCLLALTAASEAFADSPLDLEPFAATPADLLAAADGAAGAADEAAFYLLQRSRYTFDEQSRISYEKHYIIRPENEIGLTFADRVTAPWQPDMEERPQIRARAISPDGTETWLDDRTIAEQSLSDPADVTLTDNRILLAPLPRVSVDSVIEVLVTGRQTDHLHESGALHNWPIGAELRTHRFEILLEAPKSLPLKHRTYSVDDLDVDRTTRGGRRLIKFSQRDVPALGLPEVGIPYDQSPWPMVSVATGTDWRSVAREYDEILAAQGTDDVAGLAAEVVGDVASRDEKIGLITRWIDDNVRFIGLEFGQGRIVPRRPFETVERGYGDCKDKALLMIGLLEASGIEAKMALLRAGNSLDVDPALPSLDSFNHSIVYLPGEQPLWIDPTVSLTRPGELPAPDLGRLALIVDPATRELTRTPTSSAEDSGQQITREVFFTETGPIRLKETSVFRGLAEPGMRAIMREVQKFAAEERVLGALTKDRALNLDYTDPTDLASHFTLDVESEATVTAGVENATVWIKPRPEELLEHLPRHVFVEGGEGVVAGGAAIAETIERKSPFVFHEPHSTRKTLKIHLPLGYELQSGQADYDRPIGPMRLTREIRQLAETYLEVDYRFATADRPLTAAEVMAARAALAELLAEPEEVLRFDQIGERHVEAGEYAAAIREFHRVVQADDVSSTALTRLARTLVLVGLVDEARQYAEEATRVAPTSAVAHRELGRIRMYSPLGEFLVPPYDFAGASAALSRAGELGPDDLDPPWYLGQLFERGQDGRYLSDGADPEAALAAYRKLLGHGIDEQTGARMLQLLYWRERYDELRELAGSLPASDARERFVLASLAVDDPDAAVAAVKSMADTREQRAWLLAGSGYTLAERRHYPAAAALYRAAGRLDDNNGDPGVVAILESTAPFVTEAPPFASADAAFRQIMHAALVAPDVKSIRDLYLPDLRERDFVESEIGEFRHGVVAQRNWISQDRFPPLLIQDFLVTAAQLDVEGDDETGYMVSIVGEGPSPRMFFSHDGEGLWLVTAKYAAPLGERALAHLEAGRIESARTWLRWAWEMLEPFTRDDDGTHPYDSSGFTVLWPLAGTGGADQLRGIALSLVAMDARAEETVVELERSYATAEDERLRHGYELALGQAYLASDRREQWAEMTGRWLAEDPASDQLLGHHVDVLLQLGRMDEARRVVEARLADSPEDEAGTRLLADYYNQLGDADRALELYRQNIRNGHDSVADINRYAWTALLAGQVDEETLEISRRMFAPGDYDGLNISYGAKHTLACIYAELGLVEEAHDLLVNALERTAEYELSSADYFILGRIAEQLGLHDSAAARYAQVERPEDAYELNVSTFLLAQRRLDVMAAQSGEDRKDATAEPVANR